MQCKCSSRLSIPSGQQLRSRLCAGQGPCQKRLGQRTCRRVFCADGKKGFGPEVRKETKPADVKVNKRGKVATQQRPPTREQLLSQTAPVRLPERSSEPEDDGGPEVLEVPEVVNNRMLARIITFAGIPVFTGFCLYPFFYYLKVGLHVDLPMWAVYIVQYITFGAGLFGITYGVLSASWDPQKVGSKLGVEEFKTNLAVLLDKRNGGR